MSTTIRHLVLGMLLFCVQSVPFSPVPKPTRKKSKKNREKAKKGHCEYCGKYGAVQVHHIVSRGAGGGDEPDNLISLCSGPPNDCHGRVHNGNILKAELQAIKEG